MADALLTRTIGGAAVLHAVAATTTAAVWASAVLHALVARATAAVRAAVAVHAATNVATGRASVAPGAVTGRARALGRFWMRAIAMARSWAWRRRSSINCDPSSFL